MRMTVRSFLPVVFFKLRLLLRSEEVDSSQKPIKNLKSIRKSWPLKPIEITFGRGFYAKFCFFWWKSERRNENTKVKDSFLMTLRQDD